MFGKCFGQLCIKMVRVALWPKRMLEIFQHPFIMINILAALYNWGAMPL